MQRPKPFQGKEMDDFKNLLFTCEALDPQGYFSRNPRSGGGSTKAARKKGNLYIRGRTNPQEALVLSILSREL